MCRLEKNLSLLEAYDSGLAAKIRAHKPDSAYAVEKTREMGCPTLVFNKNDSKKYLHSSKNPIHHAREQVLQFIEDNKACEHIVVLGFGLGYHILELISCKSDVVLVAEKNINILFHAFNEMDLSPVLNARIPIFCSETGLRDFLHPLSRKILKSNPVIYSYFPETQNDEWYIEAEKIILEHFVEVYESLSFLNYYSTQLEENIAENFLTYLDASGVVHLKDGFRNKPALVVASGPSLDAEALGLIGGNQNKLLILCVDTSYKLLIKNNITPHFIFTNDSGKENYQRHLKGISGNSYYITIPTTHPKSFENFTDKIFISDTNANAFQKWTAKMANLTKGTLQASSNSGCFALNAAGYFGCSPVLMVGVDLLGDTTDKHATGVFDSPSPEKNPFTVYDVQGRKRSTSRLWYLFYREFERIIASFPASKFIQTSKEGIALKSAENLPLNEALSKIVSDGDDIRHIIADRHIKDPFDRRKFLADIISCSEMLLESLIMLKREPGIDFFEHFKRNYHHEPFRELIDILVKNEIIHLSSFLEQHSESGQFPIEEYKKNIQLLYRKLEFTSGLLVKIIKKFN